METFESELSQVARHIDIAETQLTRAETTYAEATLGYPLIGPLDEETTSNRNHEQSDAASGKLFWGGQLEAHLVHRRNILASVGGQAVMNSFDMGGRLAVLPRAIALAYAANDYFNKDLEQRAAMQEVTDVMELIASVEPNHHAIVDMKRGNHKRESDAAAFHGLFERRVLEAADLFPPIDEEIVEQEAQTELSIAV